MTGMERLNKYLAHAGVGSRRHCDDLIAGGRVRIDGVVVRELGSRVDPEHQAVAVDNQPVQAERLVYWLVNKPRGYLCTNHDPAGRPRALDLVPHVLQRVYTVGRLDEDSEGLLLLTNDGDLAYKLMHPRFGVHKTYLVQVAGKPGRSDLEKLLQGVWLSDGHVKAKRVKRLRSQGESTWLEIVLAEGKNREVRRMLARLEHKVLRLKRTAIGPIHLDRLPRGKARKLKPDEVEALRRACERRPRSKPAPGPETPALAKVGGGPDRSDRPHRRLRGKKPR
jgi:23S rRNA pseudouridine2605 synthase